MPKIYRVKLETKDKNRENNEKVKVYNFNTSRGRVYSVDLKESSQNHTTNDETEE